MGCFRKAGSRGLRKLIESQLDCREAGTRVRSRAKWTDCLVLPRVTILSSSRWLPSIKSPSVRPSSSFDTRWVVRDLRAGLVEGWDDDDDEEAEGAVEGEGEFVEDEAEKEAGADVETERQTIRGIA
jgi:hypothetical protein